MAQATTIVPREIDEQLAHLDDQRSAVSERIHSAFESLHYGLGDKHHYAGRRPCWGLSDDEALDKATQLVDQGADNDLSRGAGRLAKSLKAIAEGRVQIEELDVQIAALDAIYAAGPWSRFFPCDIRDGHIHFSARGCSTIRWTTNMKWRPDLSGKSVAEAVAELGEALCSFCFEDAPSDWKAKTLGQVKDERTRAEREAAKAERDSKKYAKHLLPGEVFRVQRDERFSDRVETVFACKEVLREEVELRDHGQGEHPWHAGYVKGAEDARRVLLAREARHEGWGATQEEIDKIVASKVKSVAKAWARNSA